MALLTAIDHLLDTCNSAAWPAISAIDPTWLNLVRTVGADFRQGEAGGLWYPENLLSYLFRERPAVFRVDNTSPGRWWNVFKLTIPPGSSPRAVATPVITAINTYTDQRLAFG